MIAYNTGLILGFVFGAMFSIALCLLYQNAVKLWRSKP